VTAAFQAAGTGVLTATSGAACTPGNPAGIVAGNALIAHVFYGGSTTSPDTPTDWSLLDGPRDLSTPATNGRVWVYGKKAVGGDAAPAFGTQAVTTPRRARVYRFDGVLDDTIANMVGGFDYATGTSAAVSDTGVTTGADAQDYLAVNFVAISENPTIGPFTGETGGDWTEAVAEFTGTTGTPDTCMQIQTAVVAPSTTINGGTVTPSTTNPWGVVGFYIRSAVPKTTAATLAETPAESTWTGTGTSKSTSTGGNGSGTVSWQAGDTVYVFGATAQASSTTLGTPTHSGANLPAFAAVGAAVGSGAQCWAHTWSAVATGSGSSVISETATSSADPWGIIAWVVRGSDGTGTRASDVSAAKTVSLTRSDAHSLVFDIIADYAAGSATLTWTPSGQTQREATQDAGLYTVGVADWGDQGSAGATSYGVSAGFDATGPLTKIALEILGTVGGDVTITATTVNAVAAVPVPTKQTGSTVTAATVAAAAGVPPPTVSLGAAITATAVGAIAAVPTPAVSTGSTVTPAAVAAVAAVPMPTPQAGATVSPVAVSAVAAVPVPTVTTGGGSATVTATAVTAVAGIPAPTVQAGSTVTATTVNTLAAVPAPTKQTGSTVTATPVATAAAIPLPAVSAGGSVTIAPTAIAALAAIPAPTLHTGQQVTAAAVTALTAIPAPTIALGTIITPATVAALAAIPAPTVRLSALVPTFSVAAVATIPTPTIVSSFIPPIYTDATTLTAVGDTLTLRAVGNALTLTAVED